MKQRMCGIADIGPAVNVKNLRSLPGRTVGRPSMPGMEAGGQVLWTEDPNRVRTWKDQEVFDKEKSDTAATQAANVKAMFGDNFNGGATATPIASAPPSSPVTPIAAPTAPQSFSFSRPTAIAAPPAGFSNTPTGSSYVGADYNQPSTLLTAGSGKPDPLGSTPNQRLGIGMAKGGTTIGLIPGKVDPTVADDTTITTPSGAKFNAKKGEYVLSVEDVDLLGGPDAVEASIKALRKAHGLPTETGPKTHGEPDAKGRMDKPGLKSIADVPGMAGGGLIQTWNDSNTASNRELARNFPDPAASPPPSKQQILADAGLSITPPARGISTIAGNGTTPFVPQFQGTPPAAPVQPDNIWISTLKQAGQPLTPPAAVKTLPTSIAAPAVTAGTNTGTDYLPPPVAPGTITRSGRTLGIADEGTMTASGKARIGASKGFNADGTPFDNNAAMQGIRNNQAATDNNDALVANAARINAADTSRALNRSIADRFNDLSSGNTTWDMPKADRMALAAASFNADQKQLADSLTSDTTRQGQQLDLEGKKYIADKTLEGNQALEASKLADAESTARAKAQEKSSDQKAKDSRDVIKSYYDSIKDRVLPAGFEGQHLAIAKDLANAADPATDFGIYYSPGSSRQGIATQRSRFEPLLAKYTSQGFDLKDAHSRAYEDLLNWEKANNTKVHKPFPLLDNINNRVTKPAEPLLGVQ